MNDEVYIGIMVKLTDDADAHDVRGFLAKMHEQFGTTGWSIQTRTLYRFCDRREAAKFHDQLDELDAPTVTLRVAAQA